MTSRVQYTEAAAIYARGGAHVRVDLVPNTTFSWLWLTVGPGPMVASATAPWHVTDAAHMIPGTSP